MVITGEILLALLRQAREELGEKSFWETIGYSFGELGEDNEGQYVIYTDFYPDGKPEDE